MSEERFQRIEQKLDGVVADVAVLKTDVAVLKADVAGLKTDVGGLKTDVAALGNQMRVLHEDVIDRIRATDSTEILRAEMRSGFAEVLRALADHAVPGEAADRLFARVLDDHEQRIQSLERGAT